MLGWFKSKQDKQADRVLLLIERAIREVHPDRFIDPLDAGLMVQPRLALLNIILGKEELHRFSRVHFDDVTARFSAFEQGGHMSQATAAIGDDPVLIAIAMAAMHELHNPVKREKVRQQSEFLINCLNQAASS